MGRLGLWPLRAAWAVLPVTAGAALAGALDDLSTGVRWVAAVGLWGAWAAGLLALLAPRTVGLTGLRVLAPAGVAACLWAAFAGAGGADGLDLLALSWAGATAALALAAPTADALVDGSSYGAERRFALRSPAPLLLGPVPAAWAVTVAGSAAGPLWLAADRPVPGALATLVGVPAAVLTTRALHQLSRRWVVFVPAGLVLHDPLVLVDPILFPRPRIARLGPAEAGAEQSATDATGGAPGLALELTLLQPLPVGLRPRGPTRDATTVTTDRLLFTPARPGALLAEAAVRRVPVA